MPDNSFDVVSKIDLAEVSNAVQQAMKEITQRYDLKDSKSNIELKEKDNKLILASQDEYKLKAVIEILSQKLVKRQVPLKGLSYGTVIAAAGSSVKQEVDLQQGIPIEKSREIVKKVKDSKLKVQAAIQGDFVSIRGKDRDTLQDARLLLQWPRSRYPALPYSVAGFSFGSRIALRLGCSVEGVRRIIAVGFPTKSANVEYLKDCVTPKVFVQSTNDEHGPRPELEAIYRDIAEPKQIHWIPSADHFFRDGLDALEETIFQLKA